MANQLAVQHVLSRSGWSDREVQLLRGKLGVAARTGDTLRTVFEQVADETGRKANSVRNYYYTAIRRDLAKKDGEGLVRRPESHFTPFSNEEITNLIRMVLTAQAQGVSVRACTMKMGGGDRAKMLRYQNKYRSLIKNHRELVNKVVSEMEGQSVPCFNPYTRRVKSGSADIENFMPVRRGRRSKWDDELSRLSREAVDELKKVTDLEIPALMRGIAAMARLAAEGEAARKRNESLTQELEHALRQSEYYKNKLKQFADSVRDYLATRDVSRIRGLDETLCELESSEPARSPVVMQ